MAALPGVIKAYLQGLICGDRMPAYFQIDRDGILQNADGELEMYGLQGIQPGLSAADQAPFLEGLLPLEGPSLLLRLVGMPSGNTADVHLIPGEESDWVILLDASPEERERFGLQQRANEITLLRERETRLLRKLERQNALLAEREARLSELSEFKSSMLGMAAHDLRGPLGLILNYALFLLEDLSPELSEEHLAFLGEIRDSSRFMSRLLSDLLDINKVESGKLSLRIESQDLLPIIRRTVKLSSLLAGKKGICIALVEPPEGEVPVPVDRDKIEQVLSNLVSNGIKYSHTGTTVTVEVHQEPRRVKVLVLDQGQGIPEDQRDRLFQPFGRTSVRPTGDEKSTGLGLAICKRIVQGHHGEIGVESRPGEGSTFWFTLPLEEQDGESDLRHR